MPHVLSDVLEQNGTRPNRACKGRTLLAHGLLEAGATGAHTTTNDSLMCPHAGLCPTSHAREGTHRVCAQRRELDHYQLSTPCSTTHVTQDFTTTAACAHDYLPFFLNRLRCVATWGRHAPGRATQRPAAPHIMWHPDVARVHIGPFVPWKNDTNELHQ